MSKSIILNKLEGNPFAVELFFQKFDEYYSLIINKLNEEVVSLKPNILENLRKFESDSFKANDISIDDINGLSMHLHDQVLSEYFEIKLEYPYYFRNFFIIQLLSLIESELKFICQNFDPNFKEKDLPKKRNCETNIDQLINYLEDKGELNKREIEIDLNLIKSAIVIRNRIVHSFGIIDKPCDREKIEKICDQYNEIKLIEELEGNRIRIEGDLFIRDIMKSSIKIFNNIVFQ